VPNLTRRDFLARAAAAGAAAPFLALLNACGNSVPAGLQAQARSALEPFTFSDSQRRALSAAAARLIPAQGPGDWSGADAGVVEFMEQWLNAFVTGGNPKIYGAGPGRASFATFWKLSRIKQVGWMAQITRLRQLYVDGLDELNRQARGPLSLLPGEFADLPPESQDAILQSQDWQATPFFAALFAHTMEGAYSHPVYGGNRDSIGWKSVGYQGDVHGVRFPGGFDPAADAQPWRKYGGYSPDEMILPGEIGDEV
jgi:gluconate 2-dehydrogenase gamma chain